MEKEPPPHPNQTSATPTAITSKNPVSAAITPTCRGPSSNSACRDVRNPKAAVPDAFVVGYGIDYAQRNRNLPNNGEVLFTE